MGLGFNIISHRNKFNEICLKPNLMKNLFMLLGLNQHSLRQTSDSYNISLRNEFVFSNKIPFIVYLY